jgi:predicted O-methyltransferase YrrM
MKLTEILQKFNLDDFNYKHGTDKNTVHDYVNGFYEEGLAPYKQKALSVLEIGIYFGASIKLWREYFPNAKIYGADIFDRVLPEFKNIENTELIFGDAYATEFLDNDLKFDVIIDDGPHTLESQIQFIRKYHSKLKEDSIMIIEDIADISYINYLEDEVPDGFTTEVFDLRKNKGRFDDIMLILKNGVKK